MAKRNIAQVATGEMAARANELLDAATREFLPGVSGGSYYGKKIDDVESGKAILSQDRETQAIIVGAALDRIAELEPKIAEFRSKLEGSDSYNPHHQPGWFELWNPRWVLLETLKGLLRRNLPLGEATVLRLIQWPANDQGYVSSYTYPLPGLATAVEHFAASNEIGPALRENLETLIAKLRGQNRDKDSRKIADRLQALISEGPRIEIQPGEAWSDAAMADLKGLKPKASASWHSLLIHCQTGGKGKFTERWRKAAEQLVAAVGFDALKEHVLRWFPLVDKPRTVPHGERRPWEPDFDQLIIPPHVELLRGLVWCCGLREGADLARAVARLALSAYRKLPGRGPRLVSLGNACVTALGAMPGQPALGQLAVLKVKVKFGTAQREIEKAFLASAERAGLPRDEIEELAVPSYGLEEVGLLRQTFGDYQAELHIDGSSASVHWFKEAKPLKSAPAAAKTEHGEDFQELQAAVKDLNAMLPAQRERIDTLFLAQKTWPLPLWKERYLDHPLVGTIARRLVWSLRKNGKETAVVWHGESLVTADAKTVEPDNNSVVALWHPIGRPLDEVISWRNWFERHEVVQPFKQAHREVYLLTDAERRTGAYSNRFAAHVLRQHQFNALCGARGWKNKLRLMVDDSYPPAHRLLPQWNLRAEYWIEGAGGEYGRDTNESGVFLYLTTDQVRFYPIEAAQMQAHAGGGGYGRWNQAPDEPLPLESIPPLVFSEIMRDVDLFVGVASVGNDPNWADGGPGGQYREYWQDYSFGELSATALTRKNLLERLVPRLKIADRCTLTERFLVVRGSIRTYKIHLGSGNILMEPNDQYLCIVPKQTVARGERVQLPFEGDSTLSIILSKAFLLAEDAKIKDVTITNQLKK
jgi:Domain of unknown function (DUF4132)